MYKYGRRVLGNEGGRGLGSCGMGYSWDVCKESEVGER